MGLAIAASLLIANGQELGDAESDALVLGLNDLTAASAPWKKMSAKDKQTFSDSLLLPTTMMLSLAKTGQADETSKQASQAMAREMLTRLTGSAAGR